LWLRISIKSALLHGLDNNDYGGTSATGICDNMLLSEPAGRIAGLFVKGSDVEELDAPTLASTVLYDSSWPAESKEGDLCSRMRL